MPHVIQSLHSAVDILSANIDVLEAEATKYAHDGEIEKSLASQKGAALLAGACLSINEAMRKI